MAVVLRLARHGQKKRPFYRIVAAEKENSRDGRYIDIVGTLDPMKDPPLALLKEDKIKKWVAEGAKATQRVRDLVNKQIPGLIEDKEKKQLEKIQAQRKARKARAKKK